MKNRQFASRYYLPVLLLLAGTLATSCQKETLSNINILAVSETADNPSKTRLKDECFVYWEEDDAITAAAERYEQFKATFQKSYDNEGNNMRAIFVPEDKDAKVPTTGNFTALFPFNTENVIADDTVQINLAEEQGYRTGKADADYSFGPTACPMVAYGNYHDTEDNIVRMLFHNLSGLVRLHLMSNASGVTEVNVTKITVTSKDRNLSGLFTVKDYKTNAPYLEGGSGKSVTITPNGKDGISLPAAGLMFYVALPALSGTATVNYQNLELIIDAKNRNGDPIWASQTFSAPIRRNGITYMPSLTVTAWSAGESNYSQTESGISGNGSSARPFLIYTAADLKKLRDLSDGNLPLNGVALNSTDVYVKIMRSDIKLTDDNWDKGFDNFKCRMIYSASQASARPGITNNSQHPIFREVSGIVEGITVRGKFSITAQDDTSKFSPLCHTLRAGGKIVNCALGDTSSFSISGGTDKALAGVCVYNYGTIEGCGCRGRLAAKSIAGICYRNCADAIVKQCYTASPMQTFVVNRNGEVINASGKAGGIVYENLGTVEDCYMSANINKQGTEWGGIVYTNSGTVRQSYLDASGIIQSTKGVGGIVHTMTAGEIDYCWNDADLVDVDAGGLGGIVNTLSGGTVHNCFRGRGVGSLTCRGGATGGVVATMRGGTVENCYAYTDMSQSTVSQRGTFVGTINGGTIENCYGISSFVSDDVTKFYGSKGTDSYFTNCYTNLAVSSGVIGLRQFTPTTTATGTSYTDLTTDLNTNRGSNSDWNTWTDVPNRPPTLAAP